MADGGIIITPAGSLLEHSLPNEHLLVDDFGPARTHSITGVALSVEGTEEAL